MISLSPFTGKKRWVLTIAALCILLNFKVGFAATKEFKERRTLHFIIRYEPSVPDEYVSRMREVVERLYRTITREFRLVRDKPWVWENRAVVFIARDRENYVQKFHCQKWSQACVDYYHKIIYTFPYQENFSSTLAHELTHIIFREYIGYNLLPLWLDEGMASYIQYKGAPQIRIMRTTIRDAIEKERYIPFSRIQRIYGLPDHHSQIDLFYQQSWSMVYFLITEYGRIRFKDFLNNLKDLDSLEKALIDAFGMIDSIDKFELLWKKFYLA